MYTGCIVFLRGNNEVTFLLLPKRLIEESKAKKTKVEG